jgi:hypothetical protein
MLPQGDDDVGWFRFRTTVVLWTTGPLPGKKTLTDLWKSGRVFLRLDQLDGSNSVEALLSSMAGVVQHLGAPRNALGDAHGRGVEPPIVSVLVAELARNMPESSTWMTPEVDDMDVVDLPCCGRKLKVAKDHRGVVHGFFCGFPHPDARHPG